MQKYIEYYLMMNTEISLGQIWNKWVRGLIKQSEGNRNASLRNPPPEIEVFTRSERFILSRMTDEDFNDFGKFVENQLRNPESSFSDMLDDNIWVMICIPNHLMEVTRISQVYGLPEPQAASQYLRARVERHEQIKEDLKKELIDEK